MIIYAFHHSPDLASCLGSASASQTFDSHKEHLTLIPHMHGSQ